MQQRAANLKCTRTDVNKAGELAQWLKALAALPENPGLNSRTHMTAYNRL